MTYWKDSLLIGVPQIDEQHRKLVNALDELTEDCAKGKWSEAIEKTLYFAIAYAKEHFKDEEELQAQVNYPELKAHRRMHTDFISKVSVLVHDLQRNGKDIALIGKINKMLIDWVIEHIGTEDKKIGLYIQSKGGEWLR